MENNGSEYKYSYYQMSDLVERFSCRGQSSAEKDYGSGTYFYRVEIHILSTISDEPGITVTQLAAKWDRTKGAISQIVKKLEKKGYLYRRKDASDGKVIKLYVTDEGRRHVEAHKRFDSITYRVFMEHLEKTVPKEHIEHFYEVMAAWINTPPEALERTSEEIMKALDE